MLHFYDLFLVPQKFSYLLRNGAPHQKRIDSVNTRDEIEGQSVIILKQDLVPNMGITAGNARDHVGQSLINPSLALMGSYKGECELVRTCGSWAQYYMKQATCDNSKFRTTDKF